MIYRISLLLTMLALAFTSTVAVAEKPSKYPDGTWINIDGTVDKLGPDMFVLDYGEGNVTVEMDDVDRDADAYKLVKGDKVSVSGMIDDDLYETATIEAGSVYVEKLGTYFYANSMDEEDSYISVSMPVVVSNATVQGRISIIGDDEFTLDTGPRKLTVQTQTMPYDPLDDVGYQKLKVGDYVSVTGAIQKIFFEHQVIKASSVTTLRKAFDES